MNLLGVFVNPVLIAGVLSWGFAQAIKVPLDYLTNKAWNWALLLRSGGMPSSHSAMVTATAHSIGLFEGFETPLFAVSMALALVVIYDATGIRRQAGQHAEIINTMIRELAQGHPLKQQQLREVLGHTPLEALAGMVLGLVVAQLIWFLWR